MPDKPKETQPPEQFDPAAWPGQTLSSYPGAPRMSWADYRRVERELLAAVTREGSRDAT